MKKIISIISYIIICTLICSTAQAQNKWVPKPYDRQEAKQAMQIRDSHAGDYGDKLEKTMQVADSMYKAGEKSKNYVVMIVALEMKERVYITSDQYDKIADVEKQRMQIARENQNDRLYFEAYYRYCYSQLDINPSLAFFEAKEMSKQANEVGSLLGEMYGHQMLGDVCLMQRSDPRTAAEEYVKMMELAEKLEIGEEALFQMHMDLSRAYMDCKLYDKAAEVLERARNMSVFAESENMKMVFYQTYIFLVERIGSVDEFNRLYDQYVLRPEAKTHYDENSLRYYHVRWLIKNGRYNEAIAMSKQLMLRQMQLECLYDCYMAMGDYKNAMEYHSQFIEYSDSMRNEMTVSDVAVMNAQMHNIELRQEAEHATMTRNITMGLCAIVILMLVLASVVYLNRKMRRANALLQSAKNDAVAARDDAVIAKEEAEKANQVKGVFIQNMSHELRTPLNHIYGFAQILEDSGDELDAESRKEAAKTIVSSSRSLLDMVNGVIAMSTLESDTADTVMSEVTLRQLVDEAIAQMPQQPDAGVELVVNVDDQQSFVCCHHLLSTMLVNLLSNAVKFTHEGSITVDAAVSDGRLRMAVTDTGCGIAPELREKVFERFYKVDSFVPGTGLGLSYCRVIAEKLKGRIYIDEAHTGKGTRFVYEG